VPHTCVFIAASAVFVAAAAAAAAAGFAEGVKVRSLAPHLHPALPACQHYGTCGGCSLQALQYNAQLQFKAVHIEQLLQRVGKFSAEAVQAARLEPVAAESGGQYRYRNKVQLAFSSRIWVADEVTAAVKGAKDSAAEHVAAAAASAGLGGSEEEVAAAAAAAAGVERQGRVINGWGLGFYLPGSNSVVMPVQECSLVVSVITL
jgi:tRNA/tmRNA/rRNA uracil-C5-methylase (TrmA/RlmC/RlmD family)